MIGFVKILFWISIIAVAAIFIARFVLCNNRKNEYANGITLGITTPQELVQYIRNLKCSFIKDIYYDENGNVKVVGKAGRHGFLIEEGVVKSDDNIDDTQKSIKKEYKRIIEETAIFDMLVKEENHDAPLNPYERYRNGYRLLKYNRIAMIIFIITVVFAIIVYWIPDEEDYINMVRYGKPGGYLEYIDLTYDEALSKMYSDIDWEYFESDEDGKKIVEFSGVIYDYEPSITVIDFLIDMDEETFEPVYMEVDGEVQSEFTMNILIGLIFAGSGLEEFFGTLD